MPTSQPVIVVIGCGSIGERHVRTFLATRRAAVIACDIESAVREHVATRYEVATAADWASALHDQRVTGVVIATPAPLHVAIATHCLSASLHVLVEKPLSINLDGLDQLLAARDRHRRFAAVAYVLHLAPALRAARLFLHAGTFGPIRHVVVTSGQHFPTYRPAYRDTYYRERALGGGAIQDALTHLANAVEWVVGPTSRVYCDAAHQVLDGVAVEDTVNATARNGGALVSYSLNQFQAVNETRFDFHAETGSVRVELHGERWGTLPRGSAGWEWHSAAVGDRDQLFVAQAHAFLDGLSGQANPLCTLEEGIASLRFNLAALRSWEEGRAVSP